MTRTTSEIAAALATAEPIYDRVVALAGLLQALAQVRRVADTGEANEAILATCIGSLFRFDARTTADVYGGLENVRPGLLLLRDYLAGANRDEALARIALSVMQLERRFVRDGKMTDRVRQGLQSIQPRADSNGPTHPDVLAAIGQLYAQTLSTLRPRVIVQGNPHYLGQPAVVAEVRAALLAAMRSAVLWRQRGGSLWDLVLQRRRMLAAVEAHLG
ncbi:high frequency lysogenization protein HflD [Cognatilysobacter lacus]|uniref:High frequency lysogenization protein HflD homolog n=1 Tax=Cognatilysobacter lacus TaxID=1643323 RepID=A0A5D8Z8N2_9GAMM|nr:high frequency lysogenization protein HflD [Lysobacter lacus]TZF91295.1 high frequency lysogenization protein HflD [Lysobacter lacus]